MLRSFRKCPYSPHRLEILGGGGRRSVRPNKLKKDMYMSLNGISRGVGEKIPSIGEVRMISGTTDCELRWLNAVFVRVLDSAIQHAHKVA